jgi:hypothetical protein
MLPQEKSTHLKLDFAKAFDTVNWDSLNKILQARGFADRSMVKLGPKPAVLIQNCYPG